MEIRCQLIKGAQGDFDGSFQNGWTAGLFCRDPASPVSCPHSREQARATPEEWGGGAKRHGSLPSPSSGTVRSVPSWEGVRRVGEAG